MAQGQRWGSPKMTLPIVEPEPVGRPVVVADVNIRRPVAIQIPKRRCQCPIQWRTRQRFATFVQKRPVGPGQWRETPLPIVEINHVRFAIFHAIPIFQYEALIKRWGKGHLAVHLDHLELVKLRPIPRIIGAIIGHIEVQRAIAINIGQGHRLRVVFAERPGILTAFDESPVPLVGET